MFRKVRLSGKLFQKADIVGEKVKEFEIILMEDRVKFAKVSNVH